MVLSDVDILHRMTLAFEAERRLNIHPFDQKDLQPASVDLHLALDFIVFPSREGLPEHIQDTRIPTICPYEKRAMTAFDQPLVIQPNQFVLGRTVESVKIPMDLVGRLEGKSSLGRQGILVHSTAGYIDPGFEGTITLELSNISPYPVRLWTGDRIAQISFSQLSSCCSRPYGSEELNSKYQGQVTTTPARSKPE